MMTRGRPVSRPASWLLRRLSDGPLTGACLDGRARGFRQCPRSDLVEAGAAIDRTVVPRRERYDGLTPAGPADRGVELARAVARAGALGDRPARRAPLGVVGQPLAGKEGLFAGRGAELLGTVATGQAAVLVPPLQPSSARRRDARGPSHRVGIGSVTGVLSGVRARSARARGPELLAEKIRAPSSPIPSLCFPAGT